jgi:hypothetical protein
VSEKLSRSKIQRIDGVIYCYVHDAVHEDTTGPFDFDLDPPACWVQAHRILYVGLRKGDTPFEDDEEEMAVQ